MPSPVNNTVFIIILILLGCQTPERKNTGSYGPSGYDWDQPQKLKLDISLDEISGIGFDQGRNAIIAINDEEGKLFSVPFPDKKPLIKSKFHKGADYEDLCFDGLNWYALKSNGNLYVITAPFTDSVKSTEFRFPLKGKYEFEAVVYTPGNKKLVLICKSCESVSEPTGGYSFDLATKQFDSIPSFHLNLNDISGDKIDKTKKILVSGASIHPITGDWFILASANGLLLITDQNGKCREVFKLDKKLFKQPEGICFTPAGDLYISNEARNGIANILYFPYKGNQ